MRGLLRNVRVSVFTPFSFVVVISELSGAVVVAAVLLVFAFALAFVVSSRVQLVARIVSDASVTAIRTFRIIIGASSLHTKTTGFSAIDMPSSYLNILETASRELRHIKTLRR
jgi:hypothetical protein